MPRSISTEKYYAVVPAAGVGKRMRTTQPKQYLSLLGKTVMEHSLEKLLAEPRLEKIIVTIAPDDRQWQSLMVFNHPRIDIIPGGEERCHSVLNGLRHLTGQAKPNDWVMVHDVARPCINPVDIDSLIKHLASDAVGGILAVPVSDTIKQVDQAYGISATVDRRHLWHAQTPQMFRLGLLFDALQTGVSHGADITDEASAIELAGFTPRVIEGSRTNIKITRPEDLALATFYLQEEQS